MLPKFRGRKGEKKEHVSRPDRDATFTLVRFLDHVALGRARLASRDLNATTASHRSK